MKKKLLSLLVLLMTTATGAWAQPWTSGNCTVSLSGGVLTVSGSGAMADYSSDGYQPWYNYRSSIKNVVVESGVTHIGYNSFYGFMQMTSVSLPDGLKTIGESAFQGCNNASFTSVYIPTSVTSIGQRAFLGCNKLTSVTIATNSNLTTIGDNVFAGCSALGSITIPASVTSIGNYAFYNCTNLATVIIPTGSNLTTIGNYAFKNCYFTSITIPASVTSIGNYAFQNCTNLATVTIPTSSNLTTIGDYAFNECSLGSISIPASVTSIGYATFSGCSLVTVSFSDGSNLTTIGDYAFNGCHFTSITIPASVTSIGNNAFLNCSLVTVSFSDGSNLTTIGNSAFQHCTNLATVTLNSNPSIGSFAFNNIKADATVTMNLTANSADGANWTTFYNQRYGFQADENTEVFKVTLSGTELTLNKVEDGIVNPSTAVVLKTKGNNPVMTLTKSSSSDTQTNNLTGVSAVVGVTTADPSTTYVLNYTAANGVGFYRLASGKTLGVGKAYLTYSGGGSREFFGFGETTSMNKVKGQKEEIRGKYYDLQGRTVAQPTKGLYIENGKKVFIK